MQPFLSAFCVVPSPPGATPLTYGKGVVLSASAQEINASHGVVLIESV